jgi:hypothetical protein
MNEDLKNGNNHMVVNTETDTLVQTVELNAVENIIHEK